MTARVLPFLGSAWLRGATVFLGDPGRAYVPKEGLLSQAVYDVPDADGGEMRRTTVWRLP
jgi:predicted nicotinamide N-methyase